MTDASHDSHFGKRRKRRWLRWLAALGALPLLLVAAGPYIAQSPPIRDYVVARIAERENVHATVGDASFGWFSPVEVRDLKVESRFGEPLLDVAVLRTERPWWRLALSDQRLGLFTIEKPVVTFTASPSGWNFQDIGPPRPASPSTSSAATPNPRRRPELSAKVQGAAVKVFRAGIVEPLVDMESVDVTSHIRYVDGARWLTVEPFQPLDHKKLTTQMCDNGLQLVAPILANASWVQGEVSLSIDEFRLPLDRSPTPEQDADNDSRLARASGRLELHAVETGLKSPFLRQVAEQVAKMLGASMPTKIRVADNSVVKFELRDRRVHHEGLAFGLPELSPTLLVKSSGSVGLDKSLDLRVEVPVAVDLAMNGPLGKRLSGKSLHLAVTGTLDKPKVSLPPEESAFKQLTRLLSDRPADDGVVSDDVVEMAREILPAARETASSVADGISETLARMRERRAERRGVRAPNTAGEKSNESLDENPPGDSAGDALPPPPPDESPPRESRVEAQQDDDEAPTAAPRTGPLRRLFDRGRRSRNG